MRKFANEMDGANAFSDAEMRLITVNGQTIMLEGDFENISMTNEFLNEMLLVGNPKVDISEKGNADAVDNPCINCVKEANEDSGKLGVSVHGDNSELETVQIGVDDAKALGLYFYGCKNDKGGPNAAENGKENGDVGENSWNCNAVNGVQANAGKVDSQAETEGSKVKLQTVPLMGCSDEGPQTLLSVDGVTHLNGTKSHNETDQFPFQMGGDKLNRVYQEENVDNLPAIGHLEGFQIPTSEDGVLLPATVNAKMVDGSYQTITLVPQVVNGTVTYTVHFSNLSRDIIDKNLSSSLEVASSGCNVDGLTSTSGKGITSDIITSADNFIGSVQSIKDNQVKKVFSSGVQTLSDSKTPISGFISSGSPSSEGTMLKMGKTNSIPKVGKARVSLATVSGQLPIDAKIDSLISENENVISKCKKVKYGKKVKSTGAESPGGAGVKVAKTNAGRAKKVKFKSRDFAGLLRDDAGGGDGESSDLKRQKLSLLKSSKEGTKSDLGRPGAGLPHMNLNGRLEYPNLRAIDEAVTVASTTTMTTSSPSPSSSTSLSYLKLKGLQATKQPYFNVLPYPRDKNIPVQKQVLPLSCDLQQAKNIINLQKFLESQKLQLKIQPMAANGHKVFTIRPKPAGGEDLAVKQRVLAANGRAADAGTNGDLVGTNGGGDGVRDEADGTTGPSTGYPDDLAVGQDRAANEGHGRSKKFLKCQSGDFTGAEAAAAEAVSDGGNKSNGIFIKNNPEYFSQKFKDGKEDEHPLGSSENPIQLVQTGHTFHSRQPLSETQLRQIASILQKQKFDSPNIKKNSIFDPKTNTRIVYRVVYPEDVELRDADRAQPEVITKRKRGRHKTKFLAGEDDAQKKPTPLSRGPGRPKKTSIFSVDEDVAEEEVEDITPKKKIPRTRSGRLSRPPRYMMKDYKRLHNSDNSDKTSNSNYESDEMYAAYKDEKTGSSDKPDSLSDLHLDTNLLPGLRPAPRSKRNFKPEYRCPTCQKIYLGHTRMMWHLNKFPDHCNVEKYKENYYRKRTETKVRRAARRLNMCDVTGKMKQVLGSMSKDELRSLCGPLLAEAFSIWDFLLLRVNLIKNGRKHVVDALLQELILLLDQLTKIAEDIFLPVFSKEAEKDEDCVEIGRMEVAIALGLPVGFYKINNDNLNLLRVPVTKASDPSPEAAEVPAATGLEPPAASEDKADASDKLFGDKSDPWEDKPDEKKLDEGSFWLEGKDSDTVWPSSGDTMKTLSTKFEPNLSSKILESSNDSLDDGKYEEPVPLIDLESNSKEAVVDSGPGGQGVGPGLDGQTGNELRAEDGRTKEEKSSPHWSEDSPDKVTTSLWTSEAPDDIPTTDGDKPSLWNDNSNLTPSEKVDDTNSEFLDSLLSVPTSNEFLANESTGFLADNIGLMNDKGGGMGKVDDGAGSGAESKSKSEWRTDGDESGGYMRAWHPDPGKGPTWPKDESILSDGLQERMPGVRTAGRLTSTPETNGNMTFNIPNRRNSISDFSNLNLEPGNLDMVLPSAKTLMKDCLKGDGAKGSWDGDGSKGDFAAGNVNSEDLMKIALESLTSQHDVISVPPTTFDSAMGILNPAPGPGNLNLFTGPEPDGLDFNLPLPDHLLRSNFQNPDPSAFLSTTSNLFGTTCTLSNSIKFDQFEPNFPDGKKSKTTIDDDVMEFFDAKSGFNGAYGTGVEVDEEDAGGTSGSLEPEKDVGAATAKKTTTGTGTGTGSRVKKSGRTVKGRSGPGTGKKKTVKGKKSDRVDYPKTNTIESIINEALFDSCQPAGKSLQMSDSSPNCNSGIRNADGDNYSLPIISGSLDEVENLDFLSQD